METPYGPGIVAEIMDEKLLKVKTKFGVVYIKEENLICVEIDPKKKSDIEKIKKLEKKVFLNSIYAYVVNPYMS